ncbi:MAG: class I SAM-dependent methyltransferase [Patescibacteria group bacterium]
MICKHLKLNKIKDFGEQKLYFCQNCHIIISRLQKTPIATTKKYEDYYEEEKGGRFGFGLEIIIRLFRFNRAYNIKKIKPQAKSILDIGCGRGFILYYLKKYLGFTTTVGTQISRPAAEFARKKLALNIHQADLLDIDFGEQKFDLITMLHVLEHVPNPEEYVEKIYKLLNKDGIFLVEVPNFNAWSRKITDQYWLSLDPEYHIIFFNYQNISRLLKKYNFHIKKINTFSFEYSIFTSTQSLASKISKSDQLVYKFLQNKKFKISLIPHLILFIILIPFSLLINILLYNSLRGEVLRIVAKK